MNGDGIIICGIGEGVFFDFDGNNFWERLGWINFEDGIFVRDFDGDGKIIDGVEFFGD